MIEGWCLSLLAAAALAATPALAQKLPGDWPAPRQNRRLTAIQPLPGRMRSAPEVVARLSIGHSPGQQATPPPLSEIDHALAARPTSDQPLRACVFFLVVTLVTLFQVVVVAAAEHSNSEGLVDIGGGRKMYVKCSGRGSSTIVLVGGLRASAVEATWNEDSHWWFVSLRHPSGTISNWTVDADARDYHYVCKN